MRALCPAGSPAVGWPYGLDSHLEPDVCPAAARGELAAAGDHVAPVWVLILVFPAGEEGIM